jgi:hypothetical protein
MASGAEQLQGDFLSEGVIAAVRTRPAGVFQDHIEVCGRSIIKVFHCLSPERPGKRR